jgi:hypothetical protein
MELCQYQIKILGEDEITLVLYHRAPINCEEMLLDYVWQIYSDFQSDKSQYYILNLSLKETLSLIPENITNPMHFHLAMRLIEYVDQYS